MRRAYVGLGANLGAREASLRAAIRWLAGSPGITLAGRSRLFVTPPLGPPQPTYLNAALAVDTALDPEALLDRLLEIERGLGRVRGERWGPRTLDLDLLAFEDGAYNGPRLTVPHPGLWDRDFALAPLLDVAPELLPALGSRLEQLGGAPAARGWEGRCDPLDRLASELEAELEARPGPVRSARALVAKSVEELVTMARALAADAPLVALTLEAGASEWRAHLLLGPF